MMDDPFAILKHPFEEKENPQGYMQNAFAYVHKTPARHQLGLVGGNEVSLPMSGMVDLESDLRRLNFPLTKAPERQYSVPPPKQETITRKSTKGSVTIDVRQRHLKPMQMWSYTPTFAPIPMDVKVCGRPEKY